MVHSSATTTDDATVMPRWGKIGKQKIEDAGELRPMIVRWPGKVPAAGKVENGIMSGMDWFPTLVAAAGKPNIAAELKQGKQPGDQ